MQRLTVTALSALALLAASGAHADPIPYSAAQKSVAAAKLAIPVTAQAPAKGPEVTFAGALKSARAGDKDAMLMVAQAYRQGLDTPKDITKAIFWYTKSADAGQVGAAEQLGDIYRVGAGVAVDHAKAVSYLTKAADAGNAEAMLFLGEIYRADKDGPKALAWYTKAAGLQLIPAYMRLGELYGDGDLVPRDPATAFGWYLKTAELGQRDAQYQVGRAYYNADGVAGDDMAAYMWLSIAADAGQSDAKDDFATVSPQMTPAQVADLQTRKAAEMDKIAQNQQAAGLVFTNQQ